jgi:hypothetical protein
LGDKLEKENRLRRAHIKIFVVEILIQKISFHRSASVKSSG